MRIAGREIGPGHPCYVVGEIGINHNGDVGTFLQLARVAADAGCDAVKGQVRTPEICVPEPQREQLRETPWGTMTYLAYKQRMEFSGGEWDYIHKACTHDIGITLFVSCWDVPSVARVPWTPAHKVASAMVTNAPLLQAINATRKPVILSTGMSTIQEVDAAHGVLNDCDVAILQSTSCYPCEHEDIHLNTMAGWGGVYGYSGHERGLAPSIAAVALGASIVERHITLDRTMWGTDHAASLEPKGITQLVRDIRTVEAALGSSEKRVLACELAAREKLRG